MRDSGRIAVDIGGTFTDVVLATARAGVVSLKVSSTPAHPEVAVLDGVRAVLDRARLAPAAVTAVLHGTTVGSNAILQKTGGRTGLLTTRGFRDVLEIGRLRTPTMFDLTWDKPEPLVPRHLRREVTERIAADGSVVTPLDDADLATAAAALAAEGVCSVAVCFLNAHRNGAHEAAAAAHLRAAHPGIAVTTSVSVLPEEREYERTSTTVVNAYVLPVLRDYLRALRAGLASLGITAPLLVANSNGGLARAEIAEEKPVFFITSGRAAGVAGAAWLGRSTGTPDLVAFDMGGTTASASLVRGGAPERTTEYEFRAGISTPSRFIKAGGYLMRVPTIDVAEIGNGAGSIARVDPGGLIEVGPESAGAAPGPACYPEGGRRATVTDANLVLGFLPETLAGGGLRLDPEAARAAIDRDVAGPLGLGIEAAAFGIRAIANANMARTIRAVTIERGVDPRDFALMAFGGSGPVHACDLARALDIRTVIFPPTPGVFTALGMLAGAIEHFFIRSFHRPLDGLDPAVLAAAAGALVADARRELAAQGQPDLALAAAIDLRFTGQDSELPLAFDPARPDIPDLRDRFLARYRATYGYVSRDGIEAVNIRLTATGAEGHLPGVVARTEMMRPTSRAIHFTREGPVPTPVLDRAALGAAAGGPCVIESDNTTIIVPPGALATPDPSGQIVVTLDA